MTTLTNSLSKRWRYLVDNQQQHLLCNGLKGIEKESLRISKQGIISQTPHPKALGSALTHPYITTDYSEALLEFITPPFADSLKALEFLENIHRFVYQNLGDEILLATSMPCGIDGDESIRIAEYGNSNIGKMKHIYRRGLWHRYGRTMQAIAGVHFNYSVPMALWEFLYHQEKSQQSLEDFISDSYFGLIRNFQRQGWLLLYLFGASPAICKRFFKSRPQLMAQFEEFDACTLYHPFATSLRMSDIGYKSTNQASLKIDYNSLTGYVNSLSKAINTPFAEYEKIGVEVNGEYQQLSSNILQIENEYYSTVRPKQIANSGEKPTLALKRRGMRYIEIRSLDLDVFHPIGIDESKMYFIEAMLLTCLLTDSPLQKEEEHSTNNYNQLTVAHQGRKPDVQLKRNDSLILLHDWATEILEAMRPVCEILDADNQEKLYTQALNLQQKRVDNPDLTPSARILHQMKQQHKDFGCLGVDFSKKHEQYFKNQAFLDNDMMQNFIETAATSHQQQQQIEAKDTLSFDDFLQQYFSQCKEF